MRGARGAGVVARFKRAQLFWVAREGASTARGRSRCSSWTPRGRSSLPGALLAAWGLTRLAPALRAPAGRARNIVAAAAAVRLLPTWLALLGLPLLPALEWLRTGSLAEARDALLPAVCVPLASCAAGKAAGAAAVALYCRG